MMIKENDSVLPKKSFSNINYDVQTVPSKKKFTVAVFLDFQFVFYSWVKMVQFLINFKSDNQKGCADSVPGFTQVQLVKFLTVDMCYQLLHRGSARPRQELE